MKALFVITALASICAAQVPPHKKVGGFVPPKKFGKLQLENENFPRGQASKLERVKADYAIEGFMNKKNEPKHFTEGNKPVMTQEYQKMADDICYPPLQEQFRCITQGNGEFTIEEYYNVVPAAYADPVKCPPINVSTCIGADQSNYYPVPCNCHAYYRCIQQTVDGPLLPCIYWCEPCSLVYDPNNQNCVFEELAPPGTCFDTSTLPPTSSTTPTTETTTESTTETTTESTTETTTETTTESTTQTTTLPVPCEYEGQKHPYPGDCHKYYVCILEGGQFTTEIFDCGDWVFDPHQGTCTWPEQGDELCP